MSRRDPGSSRQAREDRARARTWWDALSVPDRWALGDDLVLGTFSWGEWGFDSRPSRAFLDEIDRLRMLWEDLA